MSYNSCSKADLSGELSLLNIDVNESNNEENEASTNAEIINTATKCTNCGKEGDSDNMNICNKCDLVQYCNAACKKKHKSKHKKKCERRMAELYDEKVFRDHPPPEDCPICMLPLPLAADQVTFHSCCGKSICNGCIRVMVEREGANILCAFCRTPCAESEEENMKRLKKLMEKGNADAYNNLAGYYAEGDAGLPQDWVKANELWLKGGELGCAEAYYNLADSYYNGRGVGVDKEKSKHYLELAAMMGNVHARHNLGCAEGQAGNYQRAYKHFILGATAGHKNSLDAVKGGFIQGAVTKEEYAQTLRGYQKWQDEVRSDARDKAEIIRQGM